MDPNVEDLLQTGDLAYRKGQLSEAEKIYKAVLKVDPSHAAANHILGTILMGLNQAPKHCHILKLPLSLNLDSKHWLNYIEVLVQLNHLAVARNVLAEGKKGVLRERA